MNKFYLFLIWFIVLIFNTNNSQAYIFLWEELESELNMERPNTYNPDYIFFPQAPFWTQESWWEHAESCEEASVYLNHKNVNNLSFDASNMNIAVRSMNDYLVSIGIPIWKIHPTSWSNPYIRKAYVNDLYISEMYHLLVLWYYNYKEDSAHLIHNPSIELIEKLLSLWFIITTANDSEYMKNPYYWEIGYHVLNIIWYNKDNFITQDVWTSRGWKFEYNKKEFLKGIQKHKWEIMILVWENSKDKINFSKIYNKYDTLEVQREATIWYQSIQDLIEEKSEWNLWKKELYTNNLERYVEHKLKYLSYFPKNKSYKAYSHILKLLQEK